MSRSKLPAPDLYDFYEAAVQDADQECRLFARLARKELGREALSLREDFCGTFWLGHEWVNLSERHSALGVDLDPRPLAWGRARRRESDVNPRLLTLVQDVRKPVPGEFDVAVALNFSYFAFQDRWSLLEYFRSVLKSLATPGVFILDHFGGPEIYGASDIRRSCRLPDGRRFTYVWQQQEMNPITHHAKYAIHFEPKGGRAIRDAFTYEWRLWTLPELTDLLREAGFRSVHLYWEDDDGEFRRRSEGEEDCVQWMAYLVAKK